MTKRYRYQAVEGTMRSLFTRQLANDEVNKTAEWSDHIIDLVRGELSEEDLEQLRVLLAGGVVSEENAEPIKGIAARPGGAMDSAADASFYKMFPGAKKELVTPPTVTSADIANWET